MHTFAISRPRGLPATDAAKRRAIQSVVSIFQLVSDEMVGSIRRMRT